MDIIHCNNCAVKPKQAKICLTSCGHMFCGNCLKNAPNGECRICKKKFQAEEINSKMRPDLLDLFRDPREYAEMLMKELRNILSFQEKQRAMTAKFRSSAFAAENEKVNDALNDQMNVIREAKKTQSDLSKVHQELNEAKNRKACLLEKLEKVRKHRQSLEESARNARKSALVFRSRTEPPISKMGLHRPPSRSKNSPFDPFQAAKKPTAPDLTNFFDPLSNTLEDAPNVVTSTPIANIDVSRKEYMARMFSSGRSNPSPISRD